MRKYGMCSAGFEKPLCKDIYSLMRHIKDLGYASFEIMENDLSLINVEEIKRARQELNLEITLCVYHDGRSFTGDISSEVQDIREQGINFLKNALDLAKELELSYITGPFYAPMEVHHPYSFRKLRNIYGNAVESMKILAEYAGEKNIVMGVEPCNRKATDLINSVDDCISYIEDIGFDNIGIKLDTRHMFSGETSMYEAVKKAGERLVSVHFGPIGHAGSLQNQEIDWVGFRRGIDEISFDGDLTIEQFTCGDLEKDTEKAKQELTALKKLFI